MEPLDIRNVHLLENELLRREAENRRYLLSLGNRELLFNYLMEAGKISIPYLPDDILGGWESPTCQLRGHFLGHWLSAAAWQIYETGDAELRAKSEAIIRGLDECQQNNGGQWAGPIPEKYLDLIARGKQVWAPQYTLHKLFMGLIDQNRLAGNELALKIADRFADWFDAWSAKFTREQFDDILDVETGGMLEVWADLLELTGEEKYRRLLKRYYRGRLFEPLLRGEDPLTNMHANTTIPEILGCARAWEVTGEQKWLDIAKAYWKCAVDDRGTFATGGQTQGEIWTPKNKLKARLGDKNQEHCTVYNMIRLADFLFRCEGDPKYLHYIEQNFHNGVEAQTYWQGDPQNGHPGKGLLTYFLPLKAGLHKTWAGERDSFFCCHGTMVQANAALARGLYYRENNSLCVAQYADSDAEFCVDGKTKVTLQLRRDAMNGSWQKSSVNNVANSIAAVQSAPDNRPGYEKFDLKFTMKTSADFRLLLRVPKWIQAPASVYLNGSLIAKTEDTAKLFPIDRTWEDGDIVTVLFPIGLRFVPLPDDPQTGAFCYGPDVLAGITDVERVLTLEQDDPTAELSPDTERQWGTFLTRFRTETQDPGISFIPLKEVGYQNYQVYFRVKRPKHETERKEYNAETQVQLSADGLEQL
jgi:DUF1680 family protein